MDSARPAGPPPTPGPRPASPGPGPAPRPDPGRASARSFHKAAAWSAHVSSHLNRGVVLAVFGLYVLVTLWANHASHLLGRPWVLVSSFITPLDHALAICVLTPMVWRLRLRGWPRLEFPARVLAALGAAELAAAAIVLVDTWFRRQAGLSIVGWQQLLVNYLAVVGPAMMVAGGLIAARARAIDEREAVGKEAMIARTRLLQSQLHPHVLFNALNGLTELVHRDPPAAEKGMRHLSDLLRKVLAASDAASFALWEERALVEDYLFLEGLRLGPRLAVQWDWDAGLDRQRVIPLLLQPLVENAIKHGIAPCRAGGALVLRCQPHPDGLRLEVWNSGLPFQAAPGSGIGLANLEARLELAYGRAARFTIGPELDGTLATLTLPRGLATLDS